MILCADDSEQGGAELTEEGNYVRTQEAYFDADKRCDVPSEKEMKIAAVVVTRNRIDLLRQCVEHLLNQTYPCDILIVDNDSTDGTGEWVMQHAHAYSKIRYRNTGANLGGAGGFNIGMRWAVEEGYSHVWIMDDDTFPQSDALEWLKEADRCLGVEYGYLASAVLWTDGQECRMNRPKLCKASSQQDGLLQEGIAACEQASFVSCFVPTEIVYRAGLPIREFFIWGDDVEYTRRLAVRMSLPCYLVKKSVVVHAMKENNGSSIATDNQERIARYNYAYRNEHFLYRKEGLRGFAYYTAKCGLNLFRILAKAKDHRMARLGVILRQYVRGFFFNPEIETIVKENQLPEPDSVVQ